MPHDNCDFCGGSLKGLNKKGNSHNINKKNVNINIIYSFYIMNIHSDKRFAASNNSSRSIFVLVPIFPCLIIERREDSWDFIFRQLTSRRANGWSSAIWNRNERNDQSSLLKQRTEINHVESNSLCSIFSARICNWIYRLAPSFLSFAFALFPRLSRDLVSRLVSLF